MKNVQRTDKFLDGLFLGIKDGSEEFDHHTLKRRPREDAADSPRNSVPDDEVFASRQRRSAGLTRGH